MSVVGSNGIVVIGWEEEFQRWIRFRYSVGEHLQDMKGELKKTVPKGISHVDQDSVKHFYSGLGILLFSLEISCII